MIAESRSFFSAMRFVFPLYEHDEAPRGELSAKSLIAADYLA